MHTNTCFEKTTNKPKQFKTFGASVKTLANIKQKGKIKNWTRDSVKRFNYEADSLTFSEA